MKKSITIEFLTENPVHDEAEIRKAVLEIIQKQGCRELKIISQCN